MSAYYLFTLTCLCKYCRITFTSALVCTSGNLILLLGKDADSGFLNIRCTQIKFMLCTSYLLRSLNSHNSKSSAFTVFSKESFVKNIRLQECVTENYTEK